MANEIAAKANTSLALFGDDAKGFDNMTQDDLASLCGWEAPNLRKIEGAKTNPTVKTLLVMSEGLGVNIQELFDVSEVS